jgi:hypothetical protein
MATALALALVVAAEKEKATTQAERDFPLC